MTSSTSSAIGTGSRIGALATVSIVAGKEFRDCLRSRWLVFGSALFAILGLAVFFGTAAIGGTLQYQPLPSVMNSLLSLTVFLLPLLALLLSYDAFVGEAESGTLLLMLTYPLSRLQWLAGKRSGRVRRSFSFSCWALRSCRSSRPSCRCPTAWVSCFRLSACSF